MTKERLAAKRIMERLNLKVEDASDYWSMRRYNNRILAELDIEQIIKEELSK